MIFEDVNSKVKIFNEYFRRSRHNNCDLVYLNKNLISLGRKITRGNCNIFIIFEYRGKSLRPKHREFFSDYKISYKGFFN